MEENERMKLSIQVAYNHLKIAIEQGIEHGLTPSLQIRAFLYGKPIFREPVFNELEFDNSIDK